MRKVELTLFRDGRRHVKMVMRWCSEGCFVVRAASSPLWLVLDESFNNKLQVTPWVIAKLTEVGYFKEMKDGRFYKSDDAPEITFKVD